MPEPADPNAAPANDEAESAATQGMNDAPQATLAASVFQPAQQTQPAVDPIFTLPVQPAAATTQLGMPSPLAPTAEAPATQPAQQTTMFQIQTALPESPSPIAQAFTTQAIQPVDEFPFTTHTRKNKLPGHRPKKVRTTHANGFLQTTGVFLAAATANALTLTTTLLGPVATPTIGSGSTYDDDDDDDVS
jgi:hypothetical protein